MSELPPQEHKYTAEEVNHLVAREVAKQRMADMERQIGTLNNTITKAVADFNAKLDALSNTISTQHKTIWEAIRGERDELRKEIEKDFATKLDLALLEAKVDKIWLKVSIPVATITALVNLGFFMVSK